MALGLTVLGAVGTVSGLRCVPRLRNCKACLLMPAAINFLLG